MELINNINHWANKSYPAALDVVRFALGVLLFVKGYLFIQNTAELEAILIQSQFEWVSFGIAHYVVFAHLVGGLLLAIGLITRIASIVQIPILMGAVLFINAKKGFFSESVFDNYELLISAISLILLIVFFIIGSGPYSVDGWIKKRKAEGKEY